MAQPLKIKHQFSFRAKPEEIFKALTEQKHISNWWTRDCTLAQTGGIFHWKSHGWTVKMKVVNFAPDKLVEWECVESNMQNTDAWAGTTLRFEISKKAKGASLKFNQSNYKESPCFNKCNPGWAFVLGKSLKSYLETGQGFPYTS